MKYVRFLFCFFQKKCNLPRNGSLMIRTFHSKINKKTLFFCLLPGTMLAVYFFWIKQPLVALCCMIFLVFVIERLIHTAYTFTSDGWLTVYQGRFSKIGKYALADIEKVNVIHSPSWSFLKNRDTVMLTFRGGRVRFITPFPAEEFCRYFNRKKKEVTETENKQEE